MDLNTDDSFSAILHNVYDFNDFLFAFAFMHTKLLLNFVSFEN